MGHVKMGPAPLPGPWVQRSPGRASDGTPKPPCLEMSSRSVHSEELLGSPGWQPSEEAPPPSRAPPRCEAYLTPVGSGQRRPWGSLLATMDVICSKAPAAALPVPLAKMSSRDVWCAGEEAQQRLR